jgi:hypothetical protein
MAQLSAKLWAEDCSGHKLLLAKIKIRHEDGANAIEFFGFSPVQNISDGALNS